MGLSIFTSWWNKVYGERLRDKLWIWRNQWRRHWYWYFSLSCLVGAIGLVYFGDWGGQTNSEVAGSTGGFQRISMENSGEAQAFSGYRSAHNRGGSIGEKAGQEKRKDSLLSEDDATHLIQEVRSVERPTALGDVFQGGVSSSLVSPLGTSASSTSNNVSQGVEMRASAVAGSRTSTSLSTSVGAGGNKSMKSKDVTSVRQLRLDGLVQGNQTHAIFSLGSSSFVLGLGQSQNGVTLESIGESGVQVSYGGSSQWLNL